MTTIADRLWKVIDDVECLEENCDKSLTAESEVLREISIELTAIHAELVKEGWQPIETAPKDGTVIQIWMAHSGWAPKAHFFKGWKSGDRQPFYSGMDSLGFFGDMPMFWMPRPQPPASKPEKPNE